MKKWEYCYVEIFGTLADAANREAVKTKLNELGLDGWELITLNHGDAGAIAFLKREVKA